MNGAVRAAAVAGAVALGCVSLTGAAAPASAAGLACPAAAPSVPAVLETIGQVQQATLDSLLRANGMRRVTTTPDEVITFDYNHSTQIGRSDTVAVDGRSYSLYEHAITDQRAGVEYLGHRTMDGPDPKAALALLGRTQTWVAAPLADDRPDVGIDRAMGYDQLATFRRILQDPPTTTHSLRCAVDASGRLVVTDTFRSQRQPGNGTTKLTVAVDGDGAVSSSRLLVDFRDPSYGDWDYRETTRYERPTIGLPTLLSTKAQWRTALSQGGFGNVRKATVAAAKKAIKGKKTHKARVTAVRGAAVDQARYYNHGKASPSRVTNGAKVRAKRPGKDSYFTFIVRVKGKTVTVASNFT